MTSLRKPTAVVFGLLIIVAIASTKAQRDDYDDEGYGPQGSNQGSDADSYGGYSNDDNYQNSPNYNQQNNNDADANAQNGGYANQPATDSASDSDSDYDGSDDGSATAASEPEPVVAERVKRSVADPPQLVAEASSPKVRVKRSKHYIGPVYTYVKTDKHANFKWGVKHKVGKKHHYG